ncbi:hypothetical protein EWM64_g5313 [Hericium alpestre]|uniref:Uncharacterized protein n=1 Tax=Hericium alpestre TaxID=135208 RepID=A0A4Y9ZXQ9_9AGAM|nr:hypothetical protein EWM64_g5313 [Hericium alpestre]
MAELSPSAREAEAGGRVEQGHTAEETSKLPRDFGFLHIPKRLHWDPDKAPVFSYGRNLVFGVTCTFIVADLYWCQPLLIQLSASFSISYNEVSRARLSGKEQGHDILRHPVVNGEARRYGAKLIQACLVLIGSNACYNNFWVTLTFILGGSPYHYSTLVIGLFGLIGIFGVSLAPLVGRFVDRLVPWYATLLATVFMTLAWAIQTGAGGVSITAIVVACLVLDLFDQMQQVSLTTAVFSISEDARARLNAVLILSVREFLLIARAKLMLA